jgi:hypothetical protein
MPRHSEEKRTHALSLMRAPENLSVAEVAARTSIPEATFIRERKLALE